MAASIKVFSVTLRFLLIVFLCLATAPAKIAVAQPAAPLAATACDTTFAPNEYDALSTGDLYPQPVDPVEVFFENTSYNHVIQGKLAPDKYLTITGWRQGLLRWTAQIQTNSNGYYRLATGEKDCVTGFPISVLDGSTLEVTDGAQTYVMVAHRFVGLVDPINNTVSGSLATGLVVEISLTEPLPLAACGDQQARTILAVATAQSGRFKTVLDDFGGQAEAVLRVRDGDGSSIMPHKASRIILDRDTGSFYGTMEAGAVVQFTYTLTRAGQLIETVSKLGSGTISQKFNQPLQPGDVIEVSRPGQTLYHAVVSPLTASIDLENDQISGQAEPDQSVLIQLTSHNNSSQRFTRCFDNDDPNGVWEHLLCAQAGVDGAFAVHAPLDIRQGDIANLTLYDAQGNAQTRKVDTGSIIYFDPNNRRIETYFPSSQTATIKALDLNNNMLWQQITGPGNNYNYWTLPSTLSLQSIHSIEISDGTNKKTMTVPAVSIDPLYGQTRVSGSAPDGMILIEHLDDDPYREKYACTEALIVDGKFSVTVDSQPISGMDEFWFIHSDGQGGYFTTARASRYLFAHKDKPNSGVGGSVEQPGQNFTLMVLRGATVVNTDTAVRTDGVFLSALVDKDAVLQQGDRVVVSMDTGDSFELEIPELEGRIDTGQRKLITYAPDSARVLATVTHHYNDTWASSEYVQLNPSGEGYFEADFPPLLSWDCPVSPVDSCFRLHLLSYTYEGNLIFWDSPAPSNVTADAFEPDDSRETAREYLDQSQHHTVLAAGEEDWLRFEVSSQEVGGPFSISINNLGWKMALDYEIMSADGFSQRMAGSLTNESDLQLAFKPGQPGTYFLKLKAAAGEAFYGSCDSSYDLMIQRPDKRWIINFPMVHK